jgi:hypothetical protein
MAEAQKARHSQVHLGTQPKGNALFHYPDHCPGGTIGSGSNSSCDLPAVDAALALVPLFALRAAWEEI